MLKRGTTNLLLFFILIIAACSSSQPLTNTIETKWINMGYLSFNGEFVGCKKGMRISIQERENKFFVCKEDIPALDTNSVILLQIDNKGTLSEKVMLRAFSETSKQAAESNFSTARKHTIEMWESAGLQSHILSRLAPPFKFNECKILNNKSHMILESGQPETYSIEFEGDFESYCEYEDSNGIKFYGRDVGKLEYLDL